MDAEKHVDNLEVIQSPGTRAAYFHLLLAAERAGLRSSCNTGVVRAVRLHDSRDRYLFSWIVNLGHLLFYLRLPALAVAEHLSKEAQARFPVTNVNPGGETTIRIESLQDATELAEWLLPQLPLP